MGAATAALDALSPVLQQQPDSIPLLVERARVSLQQGEPAEAIRTTQRALALFEKAHPRSSHPPVSILDVAFAARAQLFQNLPAGPEISPSELRGPAKAANSQGGSSVLNPPAPRMAADAAVPPSAVPPVANPSVPSPGAIVAANEIDDTQVRADPLGQWAASAVAKSSYSNPNYGAARATGAPNVPVAGDSVEAWCPGVQSVGNDWLDVSFATPSRAVGMRVRQTNSPGAIARVEAFEPNGTAHLWWEGTDPYVRPAVAEVVWFAVRVPPTSYAVARLKITLALDRGPGWKQIDAVQLLMVPAP